MQGLIAAGNQLLAWLGRFLAWLEAHQGLMLALIALFLLGILLKLARRPLGGPGQQQAPAAQGASPPPDPSPILTVRLYDQKALDALRTKSRALKAAYDRQAAVTGAGVIQYLALVRNPSPRLALDVSLVLYDPEQEAFFRNLDWGLEYVAPGSEAYLFISEQPLAQAMVLEEAVESYGVSSERVALYLAPGQRPFLLTWYNDSQGRVCLIRRHLQYATGGLVPGAPADIFRFN